MQDRAEIQGMELVQYSFGIWEYCRIECERTVRRVPARWCKTGSEIDQRIAWQLLVAEGFGDSEDFIATG